MRVEAVSPDETSSQVPAMCVGSGAGGVGGSGGQEWEGSSSVRKRLSCRMYVFSAYAPSPPPLLPHSHLSISPFPPSFPLLPLVPLSLPPTSPSLSTGYPICVSHFRLHRLSLHACKFFFYRIALKV